MALSAQAKVLRVLQTGEFTRVGGEQSLAGRRARRRRDQPRPASWRSPNGQFREDLYFRLNVVPLRAPPLRERADDIPLLVERSFVELACDENGISVQADRRRGGARAGSSLRRGRATCASCATSSSGWSSCRDERDPRGATCREESSPRRPARRREAPRRGTRPQLPRVDLPAEAPRAAAARVPRGDRARVHPHQARRVRLEHLAHRRGCSASSAPTCTRRCAPSACRAITRDQPGQTP